MSRFPKYRYAVLTGGQTHLIPPSPPASAGGEGEESGLYSCSGADGTEPRLFVSSQTGRIQEPQCHGRECDDDCLGHVAGGEGGGGVAAEEAEGGKAGELDEGGDDGPD